MTRTGIIPRFLAALAVTACLIAMSAAHAHGIWFAQRATQLALLYGIGSDDLDSVKRLPLVESISGYDADWKPIPTKLRVAGPLLLVDSESQPTVVTAVLFNGIWSKDQRKELQVRRAYRGSTQCANSATARANATDHSRRCHAAGAHG